MTLRLDVRPFHERGEEPFAAIMAAVDALESGQPLLLVNSFEPKPLFAVMKRRGYAHRAEQVSEEEWHVLFTPEQ